MTTLRVFGARLEVRDALADLPTQPALLPLSKDTRDESGELGIARQCGGGIARAPGDRNRRLGSADRTPWPVTSWGNTGGPLAIELRACCRAGAVTVSSGMMTLPHRAVPHTAGAPLGAGWDTGGAGPGDGAARPRTRR
ncbi:hypothetical protein GCM10027570_07360 [Streptomonospora sediminis]